MAAPDSFGDLVAVGRTSDVYEYGDDAVIKVTRPTVPEHWPAREARYTAAVRELGAPAPRVHGIVQVEGRDAVVFERVRGPSMWEALVDDPSRAADFGHQLASIHQQILRAGLPLGLVGIVDRMETKIGEVQSFRPSERTEAVRAVGELPRGAALLHGDLHPGNVLMSPSGPAVIDWFDAAVGHPVADVVRSSLLIRPFDRAVDRPHMPGASAEMLSELHDAYVGAMASFLMPAADDLRMWEAVVAASRLAEEAETDESPLLAMWRQRGWRGDTVLLPG